MKIRYTVCDMIIRTKQKRVLAALLIIALLLAAAGCKRTEPEPTVDEPIHTIRRGDGTVLCLSSSLALTPEFVKEKTGRLPSSLLFTSTTSVAVTGTPFPVVFSVKTIIHGQSAAG